MNTDTTFTQHHHWGIIEHGIRSLVHDEMLSDEYLWEFTQPNELLEDLFGLETVHNFLALGGGFELIDEPKPIPRFHHIQIWAYHPSPKYLTWLSLQTKNSKLD